MTQKDKFENTFRSQSDKIRISPSESSWRHVERKLKNRRRHNRSSYWNIGIAASLLLLVSMGLLFYINSIDTNDSEALSTFEVAPMEEYSAKSNIHPLDLNKVYADKGLELENEESQERGVLKIN